jgi:predicted ATPase/class 3 adenylate cyclase
MADLPTGTVTFLFTDIEGSTTRWEHHPEAMRLALARHDKLLRSVLTSHGGYVFKMVGDAVYAAFAVPADAVAAAVAAQRAVAAEEWGEVGTLRVRMALHTGAAQNREDDYFGPTLNRVARVLSTGYGGQILLSVATVELVRDTLPVGASLKDLGEHALKDLLRPEHVFQLTIPDLLTDFPALKSLSRHSHNLPVQPTPFLGRQQEVASVCALLSRSDVRLVTLTGPGGIGKTRLGLQVVAELADQFADGVWFVPLAPLSDAALVVPTIMQTLSISEAGTQPLLAQLQAALKDKHVLLLLDNFEQVVAAAEAVAEILTSCPKLRVLVTSRVVLRVRAEQEFNVPPLSLPDLTRLPELDTLSQYESVALFIERAQAVKPDFVVTNANAPAVAGICARLDGLPLAIELAAARSKLLPPQALLARLSQRLALLTSGARDAPARHQTLRNTIAWSYDLLTPDEQRLFRRLSVFVGGCPLEGVEAVSAALDGADVGGSVLDGVGSLLDKSLLRQTEQKDGEPWFMMLETIREFGLETLVTSGELETSRHAHAAYYLQLAEATAPALRGPQQDVWFQRWEREYDNLRTTLNYSLEPGEARERIEMALRLCGALWYFWVLRSLAREGWTFLERALERSEGVAVSVRAKALYAAGTLAGYQGNVERSETLCQQSLALFRQSGDVAGVGNALFHLGLTRYLRGDLATARLHLEESLEASTEAGEKNIMAWSLEVLAVVDFLQGAYTRGYSHAEASLLLFREIGNKNGIARSLTEIARGYLLEGDAAKAHPLLEESRALQREIGDKENERVALWGLGRVAFLQGKIALARSLLEEGSTHFQGEETPYDLYKKAWTLSQLAQVVAFEGDHATAHALYEQCLAIVKQVDFKVWTPFYLEGLAAVVAAQGELPWAARLWGAAEALRDALGTPIPPAYRVDYERSVAAARTQLGEQAFAVEWAEGRATPLEWVITDVLKVRQEHSNGA